MTTRRDTSWGARTLVLGATMAAMLTAACGGALDEAVSPQAVSPVSPDRTLVVGLATQSVERSFFVAMVDGAKARADELGVELVVIDGRDDVAIQGEAIDRMVNDGVDALVVSPIDSAVAPEQVAGALSLELPVVAVANQIGSAEEYGPQFIYPETVSLVTNDDVDMGRKAGLFVAATVEDSAVDIAVLAGAAGTANAVLRLEGFVSELDALGVDYNIVANVAGDWHAEGGEAVCRSFADLAQVDLVFSMSDAMTVGCVDAVEEAGASWPIVSIGGNAQGLELLSDGRIVGTVCQKPATMGALAVDSAVDAILDGKTNQGLRFYDTPIVTTETLDQCEPQW